MARITKAALATAALSAALMGAAAGASADTTYEEASVTNGQNAVSYSLANPSAQPEMRKTASVTVTENGYAWAYSWTNDPNCNIGTVSTSSNGLASGWHACGQSGVWEAGSGYQEGSENITAEDFRELAVEAAATPYDASNLPAVSATATQTTEAVAYTPGAETYVWTYSWYNGNQ